MAKPTPEATKGRSARKPATRQRSTPAAAADPVSARGRSVPAEIASAGAPPRSANTADRAERAAERTTQATRRAATNATRRMVAATPTIVLRAASIIEEEVAMGIGAAKRIEQRFLDVDALRMQNPDRVMSRFRKDAHEAVDIILDIVTAAAATVGERAAKIVNVTAGHQTSDAAGTSSRHPGDSASADAGVTRLSTVRIPGTIAPGSSASLVMSLENDSDTTTAEFTLHISELVSVRGSRIPASAVMFEPAMLAVGPRSAGSVTVHVHVPADAPAGTYEGLVRANQLDSLRAMLVVTVG